MGPSSSSCFAARWTAPRGSPVRWAFAATSGKRAFGLDPLVPASIWAGTKGPATSPQKTQAAREALVPARNDPLVPVWDTNRD
jgi:hypothetical protein